MALQYTHSFFPLFFVWYSTEIASTSIAWINPTHCHHAHHLSQVVWWWLAWAIKHSPTVNNMHHCLVCHLPFCFCYSLPFSPLINVQTKSYWGESSIRGHTQYNITFLSGRSPFMKLYGTTVWEWVVAGKIKKSRLKIVAHDGMECALQIKTGARSRCNFAAVRIVQKKVFLLFVLHPAPSQWSPTRKVPHY
jgi:hypothetical protein